MKNIYKYLLIVVVAYSGSVMAQPTDSAVIRSIYDEALSNGKSYENLRYMSLEIGHRLSGSEGAEKAVAWTQKVMESYGFDTVFLQDVVVPKWVRGSEWAMIKEDRKLSICALGGSIGTGDAGITAEVVEVQNFEEIAQLGIDKVQGKIVFFNCPMDPTHITTFHAYGGAVNQRWGGASEAAKYGAVGVVVRSMTLALDDYPHTGSMGYADEEMKIPAVAISTMGANYLSEALEADPKLIFHFLSLCKTEEDVLSHNVIGEIRGSEFPDEIIVVGGHLDSWDKGHGSHDDGAGCVQSIEVLRIFKELNIQPKRTIRAVMFMNEENGLRGGKRYAKKSKMNKLNHIAAIESDAGGFTPHGFTIDAQEFRLKKIQSWLPLLKPYGLYYLKKGGSGADIGPLKDQDVTLIGLRVDSQRYFDYHHSDNDTFDKVNRRELELGGAAMAALVYLISQHGL